MTKPLKELLLARILVIDDQPDVRATITHILQAAGFEAVAVDDGPAALKEFEASQFDAAIVDIFMPGLDGAKLIKELRKRTPSLPIIAISGVLLKASGRTALDMLSMAPNLTDVVCLQKPFSPRELLQKLHEAMGHEAAGHVAARTSSQSAVGC
jgi:CheY-like chemotaxis protein